MEDHGRRHGQHRQKDFRKSSALGKAVYRVNSTGPRTEPMLEGLPGGPTPGCSRVTRNNGISAVTKVGCEPNGEGGLNFTENVKAL